MKLENIITLIIINNREIKQIMIQIKSLTIAHNHSVKSINKVCIKCIKYLTTELFSFCHFLKRKTIHSKKCKYCISISFKYILVNSFLFLNTAVSNNADRLTTHEILII